MERYEDPTDPLNGPGYHVGRPCIEPGCDRPAGTGWSPYWCQPCNAARIKRIDANLEAIAARGRARILGPKLEP